jgi:hypothetical protein
MKATEKDLENLYERWRDEKPQIIAKKNQPTG